MQNTMRTPAGAVTPTRTDAAYECTCGGMKAQRWHLVCQTCHNKLTRLMQKELDHAYKKGVHVGGYGYVDAETGASLTTRIRQYLAGGAVATNLHFSDGRIWRLDRFGMILEVNRGIDKPFEGAKLIASPRMGGFPVLEKWDSHEADVYTVALKIERIEVLELEVAE